MAIRIVIADDHSVVRRGLRMFLAMDPELIVVGEAADGEEAVHLARLLFPDIVLMDLLMPVMDGITATAVIRGELPDTEVLALTAYWRMPRWLAQCVLEQSVTCSKIRMPRRCAGPSKRQPQDRCN